VLIVRRIADRLSYANVMATIAVFIALGGGAYAVSAKKHSVGTRALKKGAVIDRKVRKNTLTGRSINELSLGTVPNSNTVGGNSVRQIHYRAAQGSAAQTLFTIAGLTVTATCPGAGNDFVTITATTDTNGSIIGVGAGQGPGGPSPGGVDDVFDVGDVQSFPVDNTGSTFSYGRGPNATPVVTANFLANKHAVTGICSVVGTVVSG
jgi:hypothetical protein